MYNNIEEINGNICYTQANKLHREDGPAIQRANGDKEWFIQGERHRENAPAIEKADGSKEWFIQGKRHREDGPAVESKDGKNKWFLNNIEYSEQEFLKKSQVKALETELLNLNNEELKEISIVINKMKEMRQEKTATKNKKNKNN